MDITQTQELGSLSKLRTQVKPNFPKSMAFEKKVTPMISNLSASNMKDNLVKFSSFHTRYYKSDTGRQSSEWMLAKIESIIKEAGAEDTVFAEHFKHPWGQNSIIATIPGKKNSTIVVGAHQDSINLFLPSIFSAPGADDDGSGSVTILEAFRVFLSSKDVIDGKAENTVEFQWYSAEEGGLLGSQAIFSEYEKSGRDVKAMLQQDMTGYVQGSKNAGKPATVGVIMDFVDPDLTEFIKKVITKYCNIPIAETKCGYACSDHASASKAGYPSAFVIESEFGDSNKHIHTSDDTVGYLDFDHMKQHATMTLAFAYELAFAKL
jgi:leucyl aminopeptidase